jgi:hypothetical protein
MKRCSGITTKQTRCLRKVNDSQSFCFQHKKQAVRNPPSLTNIVPVVKPKRVRYVRNAKCFYVGCEKDTIDRNAGYLYCSDHNCIIPECKYSNNGVRYCFDHKCHDCGELSIEGSKCCSKHKCQSEGCKKRPERSFLGCKYCDEHTCQHRGCKNQKDATSRGMNYCSCHKKRYALEKPEECPICLEALTAKDDPWPCGHYTHIDCIVKGMKPECPLCREKLPLCQSDLRIIQINGQVFREQRSLERVVPRGIIMPRIDGGNNEDLRNLLIQRISEILAGG